jgi:hypothetical protein
MDKERREKIVTLLQFGIRLSNSFNLLADQPNQQSMPTSKLAVELGNKRKAKLMAARTCQSHNRKIRSDYYVL